MHEGKNGGMEVAYRTLKRSNNSVLRGKNGFETLLVSLLLFLFPLLRKDYFSLNRDSAEKSLTTFIPKYKFKFISRAISSLSLRLLVSRSIFKQAPYSRGPNTE